MNRQVTQMPESFAPVGPESLAPVGAVFNRARLGWRVNPLHR